MRYRSRVPIAAAMLAAVLFMLLSGTTGLGAESLIANGSFEKWTDGLPDGWKVDVGAMNGADAPKSEVKPIKGPALMLRGDASTMAWHSVSQEIPARAGASYCLEFESQTRDVQQEGRQFDNCYVGIVSFDQAGKLVGRKYDDVSADSKGWAKHRIVFVVPEDAESTKVMIFLSKSGILGVKSVVVTATEAPLAMEGDAAAAQEAEGQAASGREPATATEPAPPGLLANGDFRDWTDGRPDGWKVDVGATNGANEPTSEIIALDGPGLALRGNASTMAWYSVGQEPALRKGRTYTLQFEARSEDVQRQGRQHDNCFVGVMCFDANGKRVDMAIEDLSRVSDWKKHRINFRLPRNAAKAKVLIFLSKSGTLSVRHVSLKEATPDRPFRGARR